MTGCAESRNGLASVGKREKSCDGFWLANFGWIPLSEIGRERTSGFKEWQLGMNSDYVATSGLLVFSKSPLYSQISARTSDSGITRLYTIYRQAWLE